VGGLSGEGKGVGGEGERHEADAFFANSQVTRRPPEFVGSSRASPPTFGTMRLFPHRLPLLSINLRAL
jgi:hypothetical protein